MKRFVHKKQLKTRVFESLKQLTDDFGAREDGYHVRMIISGYGNIRDNEYDSATGALYDLYARGLITRPKRGRYALKEAKYTMPEQKILKLKYRIWDKQEKKMWPVQNSAKRCLLTPEGDVIVSFLVGYVDVDQDRYVVMPSLRVADKNGKEIFEGDIVRWHELLYRYLGREFYPDVTYVIEYGFEDERGFGYELPGYGIEFSRVEVIGNIYENPEIIS